MPNSGSMNEAGTSKERQEKVQQPSSTCLEGRATGQPWSLLVNHIKVEPLDEDEMDSIGVDERDSASRFVQAQLTEDQNDEDVFVEEDFQFLPVSVKIEVPDSDSDDPRQKSLDDQLQTDVLPSDGSYMCSDCQKVFRRASTLRAHIRTSACKNTDIPNDSPKRSRKSRKSKSPLGIQNDEKPYNCSECPKSFKESRQLKRHLRTHSSEKSPKRATEKRQKSNPLEKTHVCTVCSKAFNLSKNLKRHFRIHTVVKIPKVKVKKQHICTVCQLIFKSPGKLKMHLRIIHKGENPFICTVCEKVFGRNDDLARHVRLHTGDKPFKCSMCPMTFAQNSGLKSHTRTHTGEKPHQCTLCHLSFSHKNALKSHLNVHTGNRPYKCSACPKAFGDASTLRAHNRLHTGEKPFMCHFCSKAFYQINGLNSHLRNHTGQKQGK